MLEKTLCNLLWNITIGDIAVADLRVMGWEVSGGIVCSGF